VSGYWLIALGAVPLVGALVVAGLPTGKDLLAKQIALGTSLVALVIAIIAAAQFKPRYSHADSKPNGAHPPRSFTHWRTSPRYFGAFR